MGFFRFPADYESERPVRENKRPEPARSYCPERFPGQTVMLELLRKIDLAREKQLYSAETLRRMLTTGDPGCDYESDRLNSEEELRALRKAWDAFVSRGGVTSTDLNNFIRGLPFGRRVVKKRHLRLVGSRQQPSLKRLRLDDDAPPDAA
jgi:hypothetical protein